ncbi:MAG: type II toxin-antitoxin system HigB family toxin [Bacteroidales bacterium]|nr:type II toxin-antitoxin system HigB family toxin [Bacteroidales bacterium]
MRIIAKKTLVAFYKTHEDAETALEEWYEKTENAEWDNFAQVKKTFNSADMVGNNRIVFNIKGNQYRLVTLVLFKIKMVYIRFIGTHSEYDNIKDIKNI